MGLNAPPAGEPGGPTGVYSNTDYLLLGQLLEHVTGTPAEEYITRNGRSPARRTLSGPSSWVARAWTQCGVGTAMPRLVHRAKRIEPFEAL
ncbi:serine hydrolase [Streptomyces virginiae]|uniref:serine hydrolase n=1 Tax=Streptomyces virginiae TaxID=1961 RepID=UPI0036F563EB